MENTKPQNPYVNAMCDDNGFTQYGITLKDHFAGLAMQAYIADHLQYKRENKNGWTVDIITETAYVFAESMLQKREDLGI